MDMDDQIIELVNNLRSNPSQFFPLEEMRQWTNEWMPVDIPKVDIPELARGVRLALRARRLISSGPSDTGSREGEPIDIGPIEFTLTLDWQVNNVEVIPPE